MKNFKSIILLGLLSFMCISVNSQVVITVKDLLASKNSVIISAQNASDYAKVHIKNSVNIDIHTLQTDVPYKGKLKSSSELSAIFGKKGIANTSKIIIYDKGDMKYAGRMYWILKYLGVSDVKVLDGGQKAYMAARKPITKIPLTLKPVTFTPNINTSIYAEKAYVKSKQNNSNTVLLDVRSASEFGEGTCGAAVNIEYSQVVGTSGKLKSKEILVNLFKEKGITPGKEVIIFCGTSVRAGIVYLVLKDILNFSNVKVYEGAFNDWKAS